MSATPAKLTQPVMGMILFVSSEMMFFGALIGTLLSLRLKASTWPPEGSATPDPVIAGFFTFFLLASSATQHRAAHASRRGETTAMRRWMVATLALGLVFLSGQAIEWRSLMNEGLTIASNSYGTMFFLLTGAHGLHVLGGLAMIAAIGMRSPSSSRGEGAVDAVTLYWHFVDAVWLVLLSLLYLAN